MNLWTKRKVKKKKERTDRFYKDLYRGNFMEDIIVPIPEMDKIIRKIANVPAICR